MRSIITLTAGLFASLLTACGEEARGDGRVNITVYGEDFIERGIPAEAMADGWAVRFDRFQLTVSELVIGGVEVPTTGQLDISGETGGGGHLIGSAVIPAGRHSDARFSINSISLSGSASKDGLSKSFDWRFDGETRYHACETVTTVTEGAPATFQVTVHADHFFYDSLVSAEPQVLFQALADADADHDDVIMRAELEAAGVGAYDPGSAGEVSTLWAWLVAQSRTLGHVDGEGHCDIKD